MPGLLMLSLLAATALPADDFTAASQCTEATLAADRANDAPPVEHFARATWFGMIAARAQPDGKPLFKRMQELVIASAKNVAALSVDDAATRSAACAVRFPLVAKTDVQLPADIGKRDVLCLAATSMVGSIANGRDEKTGGKESEPYVALGKRFSVLVPKSVSDAQGAAADAIFSDVVLEMVDLGTPFAVAQSCAAALGPA